MCLGTLYLALSGFVDDNEPPNVFSLRTAPVRPAGPYTGFLERRLGRQPLASPMLSKLESPARARKKAQQAGDLAS